MHRIHSVDATRMYWIRRNSPSAVFVPLERWLCCDASSLGSLFSHMTHCIKVRGPHCAGIETVCNSPDMHSRHTIEHGYTERTRPDRRQTHRAEKIRGKYPNAYGTQCIWEHKENARSHIQFNRRAYSIPLDATEVCTVFNSAHWKWEKFQWASGTSAK